jgi:hypothetical protein
MPSKLPVSGTTMANWCTISAADELRELAVTLKKIGISAAQCALGFRTAMTMNRLGSFVVPLLYRKLSQSKDATS